MTDPAVLCSGCFASRPPGQLLCPVCNWDESSPRSLLYLPVRTLLHGEYLIGRPLGKPGGFGITYLAWHRVLEQKVAIKEYLPPELAGRDGSGRTVSSHSIEHEVAFVFGREQFMKEARTLARLNHPNIVRVRSFFEENNTAYLVMDYAPGQSFSDLLVAGGGQLSEREAVALLLPILDALQFIHDQGYLHRDVKPGNLYLKEGGEPLLLDFGSARQALLERTQSTSLVRTPGYSPFEQYHGKGQQGPWTDVYAVAATLYHLVTGIVPPGATERMEDDNLVHPWNRAPGLSSGFCRAVLAGLSARRQDRPQSAARFKEMLLATQEKIEDKAESVLEDRKALQEPSLEFASTPIGALEPPLLFENFAKEDAARRVRLLRVVLLALALSGVILVLVFIRPIAQNLWRLLIKSNRLPEAGEIRHSSQEGMAYVWIPSGVAQMGCVPGDRQCEPDEERIRPVQIENGFWLGVTEVTVEAYRRFAVEDESRAMPAEASFNRGWKIGSQPIVNVSWDEAKAYCSWSGGRLPSEAEWEYAARGGKEGALYPWGDDAPVARFKAVNGARFRPSGGPAPVGSYQPNGFGLYDMAGNAYEWCEDPYSGVAEGKNVFRVLRGGSWFVSSKFLRISNRGKLASDSQIANNGFRCARDKAPEGTPSTSSDESN